MYFQPRISVKQEETDIKEMIDEEYERKEQEKHDYYKQIEEEYYRYLEDQDNKLIGKKWVMH